MAGLLDPNPDQAMMLALIGAGGMQGNWAQGGLLAMQHAAGAKDRQLKGLLAEAQLAEAQAGLKDRESARAQNEKKMAWLDRLINGGGASMGNAAVIQQTGGLAPTMANADIQSRANPISGIPREALETDVMLNGGKNLSEWMFKRGTPDMQVADGYAYDRNRLAPGFMPQMRIATNGQATLVKPGANGADPTVSLPGGALDAYTQFQQAEQRAKADYDLVQVFNPATQQMEYRPRSQVAGAARPTMQQQPPMQQPARQVSTLQPQPGMNGNFIGDPAQVMEAIVQIRDPQERANAMAAFTEQSKRTRGFTQGAGFAAGPSAQDSADAAGAKARAEADAKAAADRQAGLTKRSDAAGDMVRNMTRARELLGKGPTESAGGAAADKALSWVGLSTEGANQASALEAISGWLVANVPRMEGPQSNYDVENYKVMAGRVGDRTLPVSQRLAALNEVETIQRKYTGGGSLAFPDAEKERRYQEFKARQGK